jgi:hypothetical protein
VIDSIGEVASDDVIPSIVCDSIGDVACDVIPFVIVVGEVIRDVLQ